MQYENSHPVLKSISSNKPEKKEEICLDKEPMWSLWCCIWMWGWRYGTWISKL